MASCLLLNQALSVMRNGAVGALQRLEALSTRNAVISLLSCAVQRSIRAKVLIQPGHHLTHDSAGNNPGA